MRLSCWNTAATSRQRPKKMNSWEQYRRSDFIHHHYHHHHHPEGVVCRSFCVNASTFAVSEIASRRWWCAESLFPARARSSRPLQDWAFFPPGSGVIDEIISCHNERLAEYGWKPHRNLWLKKPVTGLNLLVHAWATGGVRFHRVRDFKQHCFNSTPPTPRMSEARAEGRREALLSRRLPSISGRFPFSAGPEYTMIYYTVLYYNIAYYL